MPVPDNDYVRKEVKKGKNIKIMRRLLSIAAMLVLVFGATWLWNRPSGTEMLFAEYYTPYAIQGDMRGGGDVVIKEELAVLYNKVGTEKDITPIITRLQTIYDGLLSNNEKFADYSYYEKDIAWYLALAYLKDNKPEKAKELLKPLADNGDENVKKLYKALKE